MLNVDRRFARARRWAGRGFAALALVALSGVSAVAAENAEYWTQQSHGQAASDPNAALVSIDKAIAIEDAPFRRFEKALILQKLHRDREAIIELEAAKAGDPNNATILFTLGYAYRAAGRNHEAVAMFEAGLARDPSRYDIVEDLAYALKYDGQMHAAAGRFREVLANRSRYAQQTEDQKIALNMRMWRVQREITVLERTWYLSAFATYRSSSTTNQPSVVNASPFTSQAGAEVGWRPDLGGIERNVDLYARSYFSFRPGTLSYDSKSLQFGAGIRWKPFDDQDFRLTLERMIKGGSNARNAFLTRASYSWSKGADIDPFRNDWNYSTFYGDLAYIPDSPSFFSAYGQAEQGWRFRLGERNAITPLGVITAQYTDDRFAQNSTVEVGGGVTLSHWYDDGEYPGNDQRVDLSLQYRRPVSSTVPDDGHVLLQLLFSR